MGMFSLGEAVLGTGVDLLGLREGLARAKDESETKIGGIAGVFKSGLAVALRAITAGALAVGAGLVTVGGIAWDVGQTMDGAFDTILVSTGATGERLEGLKDSFRTVFASVPADADTAAQVIGELNKRLGYTGETLESVAAPMLEMTRLLGGDAQANAGMFARVVGDWSVANEDAAGTLDKLFKASQLTGVGVESLMGKVVQFGSPMRLMGFTIDDAIALFAKWEKEGVNAELVMGSLRIAAGKFAAEGKPLRESLLETFKAIQTTTDASQALAMGMEIFGARAGPDMVAAIREGRFAIDDLLVALDDADGAILSTAAETADFGEKLEILKNKATVALEPLGLKMLDFANTVVDRAQPAIEDLIEIVGGLASGEWEDPIGSFANLVFHLADGFGLSRDTAAGLFNAVVGLRPAFDGLSSVFSAIQAGDLPGTITALVQAFPGLAQPITDAQAAISGFQTAVQPVADAARNVASAFGESMPMVKTYVNDMVAFVQGQINILMPFLQTNFGATLQNLVALVSGMLNSLAESWRQHGDQVMAVVNFAFRVVAATISGVLMLISTSVQVFSALVIGYWTAQTQLLEGDWRAALQTILSTGVTIFGQIVAFAQNFMNSVLSIVGTNLEQFKTVWGNNLDAAYQILTRVWDSIVSTLKQKVGEFVSVGASMVAGIKQGIENAVQGLIDSAVGAVRSAIDAAKRAAGIRSPSRLAAEQIGQPLGEGIGVGLLESLPDIRSAAQAATLTAVAAGHTINVDARGGTLTRADIETVIRSVLADLSGNADANLRLGVAGA